MKERNKNGISKDINDKLNELNKPCTVIEAINIGQSVADDKIQEYHNNINPIIVSLSIQLEVLKEMLFKKTESENSVFCLLHEDEFLNRFNERVKEYNAQKQEAIEKMTKLSNIPKTDVNPSDINIEVTK